MSFEWSRDKSRIGEIVSSYLENQSNERSCKLSDLVRHFQDSWNTKLKRKNVISLAGDYPNVFYIQNEKLHKINGSVFEGCPSSPCDLEPNTSQNVYNTIVQTTAALIRNSMQIKAQKINVATPVLAAQQQKAETNGGVNNMYGLIQDKSMLNEQNESKTPKSLQQLIVDFVSQKGGSSSIIEVMEYLYMHLKISLPDDLTLRQLVQHCNALRMDGENIALRPEVIQEEQVAQQQPIKESEKQGSKQKGTKKRNSAKRRNKQEIAEGGNKVIDNVKKSEEADALASGKTISIQTIKIHIVQDSEAVKEVRRQNEMIAGHLNDLSKTVTTLQNLLSHLDESQEKKNRIKRKRKLKNQDDGAQAKVQK